jgi:hypothetical protein
MGGSTVKLAELEQDGEAQADPVTEPWWHRVGSRRFIGFVAVAILVAAAVVGGRFALQQRGSHPVKAVSVSHPAASIPVNPQLEAAWGLRFTNVIVVADNGGVELRYQVIDEAIAGKIHESTATTNELPTVVVESTGAKVTPSAVLMHVHHGDPSAGQSYSIIYGNAGGVVHSGDFVTIVMADGLKLKHVQVSD